MANEFGLEGSREKFLVFQNFAKVMFVGAMRAGKSTLCRALVSAASSSRPCENRAPSVSRTGRSAPRRLPANIPLQTYLPSTRPRLVLVSSNEKTRCVNAAALSSPAKSVEAPECVSSSPSPSDAETQKRRKEKLRREAIELAREAPLAIVDTPGLLPPTGGCLDSAADLDPFEHSPLPASSLGGVGLCNVTAIVLDATTKVSRSAALSLSVSISISLSISSKRVRALVAEPPGRLAEDFANARRTTARDGAPALRGRFEQS